MSVESDAIDSHANQVAEGHIASGRGIVIDRCQYCGSKPAAFLVKHPETSIHWRCMGCFRDLVHSSPCVVLGVKTKNESTAHAVLPTSVSLALGAIQRRTKETP